MPIHQVLLLSGGAIVELDATEADEVKVLSNNLLIASGVVLVRCSRIAVEGRRDAAGVPRAAGGPKNATAKPFASVALRPCPPMVDLLHRRR